MRPTQFIRSVFLLTVISCLPVTAPAEMLLEHGLQLEGLWLFPSQNHPNRYHYLPEQARLSENAQGKPQFSLTFFVDEQPAQVDGNPTNSIAEASGGAILHLLVEYGSSAVTIAQAQQTLRRRLNNDEAEIVGPVVFDSGAFSVISSVLTGEGSRSATILAQRPAPVLEGQAVALSFELEPRVANILLATLQSDTPDLSVAFSLQFHGLVDGYDATMMIDWEKTKTSMQAAGGGNIYVVSLEAEAVIERAFQDGAIELVVNGDDAAMEQLVDLAYNKAMDIMYAPIEIESIPESERGGMMDTLGTMINGLVGEAASSALGFGISASYRMKDLRSEGKTQLSFDKRSSVTRTALLTMNLGEFCTGYGPADDCPVRVESTGDCDLAQRQVAVMVDGALKPEIGDFVNHVSVVLRKEHESGEVTLRELLVNSHSINQPDAHGSLVHGPLTYNSNGDACDDEWLSYQFRTSWDFVGGGSYIADWVDTNRASIALTSPYHRQEITVTGDMQALLSRNVRAVVVEVSSPFFGETRTQRRSIRPAANIGEIEPISIVLPEGQYAYSYRVTWLMAGGERREIKGRDDLGYLFIDEIPVVEEIPLIDEGLEVEGNSEL